jgi:uncharacterized paraquat-inducible protein A
MHHPATTTDRVRINCPGCHAKIKASRELLGQVCPCPRCRHAIFVQIPLPSDADINLVEDDYGHPAYRS